ncbi:MAG: ankyrin repeat domain-containing protein [Acholeplasmatales bacterium]|nr:ankyrin repeat domain-containing protein [Acholeplasmatales bacterium]
MDVFDSVYCNNIEALKEYLATGNINIKNERGLSLLHNAIIFNNPEIFELLLDNYINVNITDNYGETPLMYAVTNNRMGFVKNLLRHGADLNVRNNDGQTALFKACYLGREQIVYLLLESINFDLHEKDNKDETLFMALVRSRNINLLEKVRYNDKIIEEKNYLGETPLHIACKSGDAAIVEYLIMHKAFVNSKNNNNETPLFYAAKSMSLEVIDLLMKYGANPDCKSKSGQTVYDVAPTNAITKYIEEKSEFYKFNSYKVNFPLHYSIVIEDLGLVEKNLVIRNLNRSDQFGYKPKDLANLIGNDRILNLFQKN